MYNKLKIAITTNIIPLYRQGFYDRLFSINNLEVTVFCQDSIPGRNISSIHTQYPMNVQIINHWSFKNEKIVWQFIPWKKIIRNYDIIFVSGNPRVISDFLFATYLRLIKKNVVLWTMACSYRNNRLRENLRLIWSKIFPVIFVYTDKEVNILREKGFKNNIIIGMNNGLDQRKIDNCISEWNKEKLEIWKKENDFGNRVLILSSSRLLGKNRFDLMIEAMPIIINKLPNILWIIIGNGAQEDYLKSLIKKYKIENYINLLGEQYDENIIAPYFLSSCLFIHPASIGLSLLHAFGYGLPVITNDIQEEHGPEYAAFEDGITGLNYKKNNHFDLAEKILKLLSSPDKILEMQENVLRIARKEYNVDIMVERFLMIANTSKNNN